VIDLKVAYVRETIIWNKARYVCPNPGMEKFPSMTAYELLKMQFPEILSKFKEYTRVFTSWQDDQHLRL
jgi:hypothetical protein